jgi:hypothetical protein
MKSNKARSYCLVAHMSQIYKNVDWEEEKGNIFFYHPSTCCIYWMPMLEDIHVTVVVRGGATTYPRRMKKYFPKLILPRMEQLSTYPTLDGTIDR